MIRTSWGKRSALNKQPYTIVGVTPEGFYGTEKFLQPDIFVPMANEASLDGTNWLEARNEGHVYSIVRIKDGLTLPQVQAELNTIAARIRRQYPKEEEKLEFKLTRPGLMGDFFGAPARGFLAGVLALAGIVLMAACANLGSLFAARTADRTREIAIRMAIGSSRWRIVRQILVEADCDFGTWRCVRLRSGVDRPVRPGYVAPTHRIPLPPPFSRTVSLILIGEAIAVAAGVLFGVWRSVKFSRLIQVTRLRTELNPRPASVRLAAGHCVMFYWLHRSRSAVSQSPSPLSRFCGQEQSPDHEHGFQSELYAVMTKFELSQADYSGVAAEHFQRQLLDKVSHLPGVEAAGYASQTPLNQDATNLCGLLSTNHRLQTLEPSLFIPTTSTSHRDTSPSLKHLCSRGET